MTAKREHENCPSCICGRRARVQGDYRIPESQPGYSDGTIAWAEHERAWGVYAKQYGYAQSAERIHERGGFSYLELAGYLGRAPETWTSRVAGYERVEDEDDGPGIETTDEGC